MAILFNINMYNCIFCNLPAAFFVGGWHGRKWKWTQIGDTKCLNHCVKLSTKRTYTANYIYG
jgi:hypothetical protein